ncbi:hypothetical protein AMTR_s00160p00015170, partial [Amborella trichopoda]
VTAFNEGSLHVLVCLGISRDSEMKPDLVSLPWASGPYRQALRGQPKETVSLSISGWPDQTPDTVARRSDAVSLASPPSFPEVVRDKTLRIYKILPGPC